MDEGGYFLSHFFAVADNFLLGSMALCVARTFLTHRRAMCATRFQRRLLCDRKVTEKSLNFSHRQNKKVKVSEKFLL